MRYHYEKDEFAHQKYTEIEPVSIYHVEYEPKLVVRGTTSYPRSEKRKINKKRKNIINKEEDV